MKKTLTKDKQTEKRRLFQVLDEMNVEDIEKGTRLVEVSSNLISANTIKQGGKITMGVPQQTIMDLTLENKIPVLLMVDKDEYFKRMKD